MLPTAYLSELVPSSHITVMNGNTHKSAFSFTELLKILIYFNGKPATE